MKLEPYYKPFNFKGSFNTRLKYLNDTIQNFQINLNPDFQREYVWSIQEKSDFMGHFLSGGIVQPLYINVNNVGHDILDGKQRINCCLEFLDNRFPATIQINSKQSISFFWSEVEDKCTINDHTLHFKICEYSRFDLLNFYVKLNRTGRRHDDKDIETVMKMLSKEFYDGN